MSKSTEKRLIEILCFVFVISSFLIIGYCTYKSYENKKKNNDDEIKIDNYYNSDYLFNSGYIKVASTISDFKEKEKSIYMYLDKDNTLYIKYINKNISYNKHVSGLPKGDIVVYYNDLNDGIYELSALTKNGVLYYSKVNLNNKKDHSFSMVDKNIDSVYTPVYDKNYIFIKDEDDIKTNFIFLDKKKNLKYLDTSSDKYVLKDNLKEVKPYFDYICALSTKDICVNTLIYQDFNNNLLYTGNNEFIRDENNKIIVVNDTFVSFEIDSSKEVDFSDISFKKLSKKYNFKYNVYIVSKTGYLYEISFNNDSIKGSGKLIAKKLSSKKVKQVKYDESGSVITGVHVIYVDGTEYKFYQDVNKKIMTSTIYVKTKNKTIK